MRAGHNPVSKADWVLTGIWKFLSGSLDLPESMEWAKKKVLIEKLVEDIRKTLEEALEQSPEEEEGGGVP